MFAEKPGQFLDSFSQEFESDFLTLLKRTHGTKRTFANAVYQEYIKEKVLYKRAHFVKSISHLKIFYYSGTCAYECYEMGNFDWLYPVFG